MTDAPRSGSTRPVVAAAVTAALAGLTAALEADTLTVCPDGTCGFTAVDAAIDAAADGDRIEIGPGEYPIATWHDLTGRSIEIVGMPDGDGVRPQLRLSDHLAWQLGSASLHLAAIEIRADVNGLPAWNFTLTSSGDATSDEIVSIRDARLHGLRSTLIDDASRRMDLVDCAFTACEVPLQSYFIRVGRLSVERCDFHGCTVGSSQGSTYAIMLSADEFTAIDNSVLDCAFASANSDWFRPAYDGAGRSATIRNCRFENNAAFNGMITLWSNTLDAVIDSCDFLDNRTESAQNTSGIIVVDAASLVLRDSRFEGGRFLCDRPTSADLPRPSSIRIYGGQEIVIDDCDFVSNAQAVGLSQQSSLGPIQSLRITRCRFLDNGPDPDCDQRFEPICLTGAAFAGFHLDPNSKDDPPVPFEATRVVLTDNLFVANTDVPISGAWTDAGGNILCDAGLDTDGDGVADACDPDAAGSEIHVPGDVPDLDTAFAVAQRGQSIVLAPGDHEIRGFTRLDAAALTIRGELVLDDLGNTARITIVADGDSGLQILSSPGHGVRFEDLDIVLAASGRIDPACSLPSQSPLGSGSIAVVASSVTFSRCRMLAGTESPGVHVHDGIVRFEHGEIRGPVGVASPPAIQVSHGDLTLDDVRLQSARIVTTESTAVLRRTRIEGVTGLASSIDALDSDVRLERCDVLDNIVDGSGAGGVQARGGHLVVSNSWFIGNASGATTGGAIRVRSGGTLEMADSAFCDNTPDDVFATGGWTDLGDNAVGADGCARAAGDLDGDGCVRGGDLGLLFQQWSVTSPSHADLDRDGVVGGGDLGVIFTNWGRCF